MPYGKKSTKRRRRSAGRRRKSVGKRGLSKATKEQIVKIVHGEAELKGFTYEKRDEKLFVGRTQIISGVYKFAPPTVIKIGNIFVGRGDKAYERIGESINMRHISLRMWFNLEHTITPVGDNLKGPRRVLWWVVSFKPSLPGVVSTPGEVIPGGTVGVNFVQGENSDFTKFFKLPPQRTGELDDSAAALATSRNFEGDMYDEIDQVNRDIFTVHSSGKFDIGYSASPHYPSGTPASDFHWFRHYGKVPYRKQLTVPIPKYMYGKTDFTNLNYTNTNPLTDGTDKRCFLVMTSIPLTGTPDNPLQHSGIEYDYRLQYKFTDM